MADLKDLQPVERKFIRPCDCCGEKLPTAHFYRLDLSTCILDMQTVSRQVGLEMMLGNAKIADVMGTGEPLARIATTHQYTVCPNCISKPDLVLYLLDKDA